MEGLGQKLELDSAPGWAELVQSKPDIPTLFAYLDGLVESKDVESQKAKEAQDFVTNAVDGYDRVGDRFLDVECLSIKPEVVGSGPNDRDGWLSLRTRLGKSVSVKPVPDWKGDT